MSSLKSVLKINFIKYVIIALSSFIIDIILFSLFNNILDGFIKYESVLISTILARIISSLYNYGLNAKYVFKKNNLKTLFKYYELVIVQMLVSALLVYIINKFFINNAVTIIKILIDILIFIINYIIQKKVVFK